MLRTVSEVKNVLDDVSFSHFRVGDYGIWLSCSDTQIVAHLFVPDRDNPELCIPLEVECDVVYPLAEDQVLETARSLVHALVAHEIDECLLYKGDRIWDPHVNRS